MLSDASDATITRYAFCPLTAFSVENSPLTRFLPLADNNFRDNIVICGENLSQQMNAQEYFDLNLQQLQGIKILNKGKVTIDGYEGRVIKYVADIQGGSLQQEQIYIVVGNRGYVITISSLPDRFEKSRKDAYRVVNTITF